MTIDALIVLGALFAAFVTVYRDWLSADLALMAGLSAVAVFGVVEPAEIVRGFSSTVVVAVASLYVLFAGIWRADAWRGVIPNAVKGRVARAVELVGFGAPRVSDDEESSDATEAGMLQQSVAYAAPVALVVLPLAGIARLETVALAGAVATVVSGLLSAEAARRAVDWEIVVVVGAVVGFSQALVATGVAASLAALLHQLETLSVSPLALAVGLTSVLVLSALTNRRAAASVVPLALSTGLFAAAGGIL